MRKNMSEKTNKGIIMNSKIIHVILALLLVATINASADNRVLSFETLSHETLLQSDKYEKIVNFDHGHHKTIIRISELPKDEAVVLKWKRPLVTQKTHTEECRKEQFLKIAEFLGEENPAFLLSSKGFLPGEKITFSLETTGGTAIGQPLEFFPQPLIQETRSGESKLIAELSSLSPSTYEITFEGIPSFETLIMSSFSSGEKLVNTFQYRQGSCIGLMPGVVGKEGGSCKLSIQRQKGEKFQLDLPWGDDLLKHLGGECLPVVPHFTAITGKSEELK